MQQRLEGKEKEVDKKQQKDRYIQELYRIENKRVFEHMMAMQDKMSWRQKLQQVYLQLVFKERVPYPENEQRYKYMICRVCWDICNLPLFNTVIMLAIFSNSILLATDRYPEPTNTEYIIQTSNLIFTVLYTAECVIKLIGLPRKEWKTDIFNAFDFLIVIALYLELAFQSQTAIIGAVRSLRLLKLIKLVRSSNVTLEVLIDSIVQTIAQCANFIIILFLFIYVFSLLGMELFATKFKFDINGKLDLVHGYIPRQNYNDIFSGLITTFQVLIGEKWNEIMYLGIESKSDSSN